MNDDEGPSELGDRLTEDVRDLVKASRNYIITVGNPYTPVQQRMNALRWLQLALDQFDADGTWMPDKSAARFKNPDDVDWVEEPK